MKFRVLAVIEHLFHCNLKPTSLVIEVEVANENLPSKKTRYEHVFAILQEQSHISQIVELPKPIRTHKSSKMNLLSQISWPMTPTMAITTREAMHVFDGKKELQTYCNFIQNIVSKQFYYFGWKYCN
jgi:hypothetical protein